MIHLYAFHRLRWCEKNMNFEEYSRVTEIGYVHQYTRFLLEATRRYLELNRFLVGNFSGFACSAQRQNDAIDEDSEVRPTPHTSTALVARASSEMNILVAKRRHSR